ncbi:MAG: hypothetical protein Q8N05_05575 [Bacteroidota bacterium]|nr:hypothetical protein [Bacteroidota bacterium]
MAKNKFKKIFFGRATLPVWLALATFGLTELLSRLIGSLQMTKHESNLEGFIRQF